MFNGRKHNYFQHPRVQQNERRMEISLGIPFVQRYAGSMIEVGNVTRMYKPQFKHHTIDLHEKHDGWKDYENEDVLTYTPKTELQGALSISTLEHTTDPVAAIARMLSWAPNVLITIPLGYNCGERKITTCAVVREHDWPQVKVCIMQRTTEDNQWKQIDFQEYANLSWDQVRYGKRFPCANFVAVLLKGRI